MPKTEALILTYASDGRRLRSYSQSAIERLAAADRVVLMRNRKGRITSAHFREIAGASPIANHAHMGQHYSYETRVGDARLWQHRPLLVRADRRQLADQMEYEEAELFIRGVFRAVPLSCLSTTRPTAVAAAQASPNAPPQPAAAKVVSIADYAHRRRSRRSAERPVEFDSEQRAA